MIFKWKYSTLYVYVEYKSNETWYGWVLHWMFPIIISIYSNIVFKNALSAMIEFYHSICSDFNQYQLDDYAIVGRKLIILFYHELITIYSIEYSYLFILLSSSAKYNWQQSRLQGFWWPRTKLKNIVRRFESRLLQSQAILNSTSK